MVPDDVKTGPVRVYEAGFKKFVLAVSEAERGEDSPGSGQQGASTSDCSFEERYMNILRELQFGMFTVYTKIIIK